jgi:hypothetical protein
VSWEASAHVLKLADSTSTAQISPMELLVLYVLAARHHRDARCAYGQYRRMAQDTHLAVSTLVEAINHLEDLGFVRVYFGPIPLFKDAPRNADGTPDKRSQRGNLYCFIGLDPDDGPNIEGVEPRRRVGGRPNVSSDTTNSLSEVSSDLDAGQLAGEPKVSSAESAGQLAGLRSKPTQPVLRLTGLLTGEETGAPRARGARERGDEEDDQNEAPTGDAAAAWELVLEALRASLGSSFFEVYLAGSRGLAVETDALVVAPAKPVHVPWLEGKLAPSIQEAARKALGGPVRIAWRASA